jgi:oligopeptide transport system permease protein
MAVASGAVILVAVLFSSVGPLLARRAAGLDGTSQDLALGATAPSWAHPFGTDPLGRDLMVRTMQGGRIALGVALVATTLALAIGVFWGAVAGYAGGKLDEVMMRLVDILYAFPRTVLVIVVMAVLGTRSLILLAVLVGGTSWLTMARIVRGQVMSLGRRDFAVAARSLGLSARRILCRHILPNAAGPIIVYAAFTAPAVMLTEASLSFLGIGVEPPDASWGTLVFDGSRLMAVYPWLLVGPGLVMSVTIFALHTLGDGLRDALDPEAHRTGE